MTEDSHLRTSYRHVYDVDAFEILDRMKEKYKSNNNIISVKSLKFEEDNLVKFLIEEGFNEVENQKNRNFILPSNYNLYNKFLSYKLLTMDVFKIEPLLSYQSVLFLGNEYASKDNFIGLLEFLIYDIVKEKVLPNEQIRLEKMVNWLERNRTFLNKKAYYKTPRINDSENKRIVTMDTDFANVFFEKFKVFFKGQETELFDFLINNESTELLNFNGKSNQLAELFKRLRYNSKIQVSSIKELANWIVKHFTAKNKQKEFVELKINTISQVLSKPKAEPIKTKRILLDVAEFIPQNQRKEK
ncbi:hypothetical protein [Flavobacterium sp.]|jgi:hypothetical protein|uniref:hypothetical protein n=4 Tax=Flavobacterium sp. TaxID=239 RepID=UPI0034F1CE40